MIEKAIRQAVSRQMMDLSKLGTDPRSLRKYAETVRKVIPLPARWFVKVERVESALNAIVKAVPTSVGLPRRSGMQPAPEATARSTNARTPVAEPHFERARARLAERGITLKGEPSSCSVLIQLQKRDWPEPRPYEIGKVTRSGASYEVLMLALPYFLGPTWKTDSDGGKPQLVECETEQDLVELLECRPGAFIHGGILHTQD